jgi:hypothetical protein
VDSASKVRGCSECSDGPTAGSGQPVPVKGKRSDGWRLRSDQLCVRRSYSLVQLCNLFSSFFP